LPDVQLTDQKSQHISCDLESSGFGQVFNSIEESRRGDGAMREKEIFGLVTNVGGLVIHVVVNAVIHRR
jgi:hypothetical protein